MFSFSLAPTSAPKRWYSKPHSVQDEFDELAYLEAKFVHDREQALEVHCPMIVPPSTFNNTNMNNNNNSLDDPSMDDLDAQDIEVTPSGEIDVTFTNDASINNGDAPDSFISQHSEIHNEPLLHQQYSSHSNSYQRRRSNSYTPTMMSTGSYPTPNQMTMTPNMQFNFFTPPAPIRTAQQQGNPSSPDIVDYMSSPPSPPPPPGRSLRQYMDESSRRFMEPEIMDRLIRYDDDDDASAINSTQSHHRNNSNNDDQNDERRRLRRSNLFE